MTKSEWSAEGPVGAAPSKDEAPKKGWEKCPQCQARIRAEGLANENELQAYFMHRLEKFVNSRGKRI